MTQEFSPKIVRTSLHTNFSMFFNYMLITLFMYLFFSAGIALITYTPFREAMGHRYHVVFFLFIYWWPGLLRVQDMINRNAKVRQYVQSMLERGVRTREDLFKEMREEHENRVKAKNQPEEGK